MNNWKNQVYRNIRKRVPIKRYSFFYKKDLHFIFQHYIIDWGKLNIAGWSSLVARRAHNPKVVGSNPAPATNYNKAFRFFLKVLFFVFPDYFPTCLTDVITRHINWECLTHKTRNVFLQPVWYERIEVLFGKVGNISAFEG